MHLSRKLNPQKALEMTMRDVMDSMEDAFSSLSLHYVGEGFEIIAIEPECPAQDFTEQSQAAEIIPLSLAAG